MALRDFLPSWLGGSRGTSAPSAADKQSAFSRDDLPDPDDGSDRNKFREKAKAGPAGIKMPAFLPWFDDPTGPGIAPVVLRRMVNEPYIKAALKGKVVAVAALDLKVHPASTKTPKDKAVAEFLKWNMTERLSGGVPALAWNILMHGCIDGHSVNEKVKAYESQGRYKGKTVLKALKPKRVGDDVVLKVDEWLNVTSIMGLRYNAATEMDPADFLVYRHDQLYDSPTGTSDLKAAYRDYWTLDSARKLRLLGLNRAAMGVLIGTYESSSQKASLETMLTGLSSGNWASVPEGVEVKVLDLAASSVDVFDSAEKALIHSIFLSIQGAFLQALEGSVSDGAGNSQVHRSTADLWVWFLSVTVQALLNDRDVGLVKWLIDQNYVVDEYPRITLGAVDVNEQTLRMAIYAGAHALGMDLSKEQAGEELGLEPPLDDTDKLPGAPPQGGPPPGGPPAAGGSPFAESVDVTTQPVKRLMDDTPDKFCQEGPNKGKPGVCPKTKPSAGGGAAKAKPAAKSPATAPAAKPVARFQKDAATRSEMTSASRVGKGKDAKIVLADGTDAPAHIQAIAGKIPPDWTEIHVAKDPSAEVLATGRDSNGAAKTVYSDAHDMRTEAIKFARTSELIANHDKIQSEIQRDRKDPAKREQADASWLMLEQGTRPGSEDDNKGVSQFFGHALKADDVVETKSDDPKLVILGKQTAAQKAAAAKGSPVLALRVGNDLVPVKDAKTKEELLHRKAAGEDLHDTGYWLKSHGATTLEGRHIVEGKDGVRLQFVGKEGVWHDHLVQNPEVAKMLVERKAAAGDSGKLFKTNETKVRDYVADRDGGGYLSKDLRTGRANLIAMKEVAALPPPQDEKEYKSLVKRVAEKVSGVLGNRPVQALESYINPAVFSAWHAGLQGVA